MQLELIDDLPFINISAAYKGAAVDIPKVLIDTGSSTTILAADIVASIGIIPEMHDVPHIIRGVGGSEIVYNRYVDYLKIGEFRIPNFKIEVGGMNYGFEINGILGMDFLRQAGAIINLQKMIIDFNASK